MKRLWKKRLENVDPYIPGKPIEEVKRELGLKDVVKLASNEIPCSPSPKVIKAIRNALSSLNRYPDGSSFYLKKAISKKFAVKPENLVIGNGSDELIVLAIRAFLEKGDEVVIANPTFLVYKIASAIEGAVLKQVAMKNFQYDIPSMVKAMTPKTKLVFIANPNNPTGTYITGKDLEYLIAKAPERTIIFIDEAYYDFAKGGKYPETLKYIDIARKNVIIARTFSKVYGLAGLRVGYAFARKDLANIMNTIREPFNVNSLAQVAALGALRDTSFVLRQTAMVKREKKRYELFFKTNKIKYVPSRSNFFLINTERDSKKIAGDLLKKGVIVREMTSWGIPGFIRVNMGLPSENTKFFKSYLEAAK
ncbi:MAG: histidinol-phosphate transaminase [Candidatus Omnitrophica bacterium]|nr:histidinol-phosphate transaminase [Candidatus Omnitrophota bacterium]